MDGRILVGEHDGVYVLLFQGDVRLTLCAAVDDLLDRIFRDEAFRSIQVDLSEAESIDSTSLGLLAKLSIQADRRFRFRPTLVSTQPDITRVLLSMGFEDVFNIVETPLEHQEQLAELPGVDATPDETRQRVIDAHRILMGMNESNQAAFKDLVSALEAEQIKAPSGEPGGAVDHDSGFTPGRRALP